MDEYKFSQPMSRSEKRLRFLAVTAAFIWILLSFRLWFIQVHSHSQLSKAAAAQYQVVAEGMDSRGAILDRNLQPLTGGQQQYYYFLRQEEEDGTSASLLASIGARLVSAEPGQNPNYHVYRTALLDPLVNQTLRQDYDAYVFRIASRYTEEQTACHLIGYLNESEKKGVAGLEKAYEDLLQSDGSRLTLWADGKGRLLLNVPPKKEGGKTLTESSLVTSLDAGVQKAAETLLQEHQISGAVLVSHSESGQILAWASSPVFRPNAVEDYLGSGSSSLVNKCIQGTYAPGSVFKIVTAAAALEQGLADPLETYRCTGTAEVEGVQLGCQSGPEGGHGEVNMYQAMAQSCNCYFAELGAKIGDEAILDMASRLGLGTQVFGIFSEEERGFLPTAEESGPWDISNLSIGQGTLLVTPAQIHQMMSVIACGGRLQPLTVVSTDRSGAKSVLSVSTAAQLSAMLAQVMEEGTGKIVDWPCPVYGKTGTAEASLGGESIRNCWFSGFCEVDGEIYTVTILAEQGISGSASALPLFEELVNYLMLRNLDIN